MKYLARLQICKCEACGGTLLSQSLRGHYMLLSLIHIFFDEYAIKGGLAGSYAYRTEKDRTNYIKEVYETIVTRDLVQKYTLPDTLVLQLSLIHIYTGALPDLSR